MVHNRISPLIPIEDEKLDDKQEQRLNGWERGSFAGDRSFISHSSRYAGHFCMDPHHQLWGQCPINHPRLLCTNYGSSSPSLLAFGPLNLDASSMRRLTLSPTRHNILPCGSIHTNSAPTGTYSTLHGLHTYISPPPSTTSLPSTSTIIFLTDAFGFNLPNSFLLADHYARQTGFRVLMPDWIPRGGVPLTTLSLMETMLAPTPWYRLLSQLKLLFAFLRVMTIVIPFAMRIKPAPATILAYARAVKASLPPGAKLGVAGFCIGEMHSTKLSQEPSVEGGEGRLVDAQFCAHPAGLKLPDDVVEAITRFEVPYSFAIGDQDFLKIGVVEELQASLKVKVGVPEERGYEVRVYEGCGHGFAVRASEEKGIEDEAAEEAAVQAVEWFKRYLT